MIDGRFDGRQAAGVDRVEDGLDSDVLAICAETVGKMPPCQARSAVTPISSPHTTRRRDESWIRVFMRRILHYDAACPAPPFRFPAGKPSMSSPGQPRPR